MTTFFAEPLFLLLLVLYAPVLWLWRRSLAGPFAQSRVAQKRHRLRLAFHGAAALALVLAAAGLQLPSYSQRTELVVAADVSESMLDAPMTEQISELLSRVDRTTTGVGVVVFGGTAGIERRMTALPEPQQPDARRDRQKKTAQRGPPPLPDLSPQGRGRERSTVVDRKSTDIGGAIERCRGLFSTDPSARNPGEGGKGILLVSDFRDTKGRASAVAAALSGSGIDLLPAPAVVGQSPDFRLDAIRVPDSSKAGRDIPIEVTVASQTPGKLQVNVWRKRLGQNEMFVGTEPVVLSDENLAPNSEIRKTIRVIDRKTKSGAVGVVTYTARLAAPENEMLKDINVNNQLSAAVRIDGPSVWAVLTRPGSTLAKMCGPSEQPGDQALGVKTKVFLAPALPKSGAEYATFEGILVDGFSAAELSEANIKAIADAADSGKGLVALGGEQAFGAGGHREGTWEQVLPVQMMPEDDRTRTVLFIMDVSSSMNDKVGSALGGGRKLDFAGDQLAQAVQKLKDLDRLGLITFSGAAHEAAKLSTEPKRTDFLTKVRGAKTEATTDFLPPLELAKKILADDDAEEQIVILISDGKKSDESVPNEKLEAAVRAFCPPPAEPGGERRTTLHAFGIDVDASERDEKGEALMKLLAAAGGGTYIPEFSKLAQRLEATFAQKKGFFARYEKCALQAAFAHPLLGGAKELPVLSFRNRVKAKSGAETILFSAPAGDQKPRSKKPDPLLVLSGADWPGAARCAVLPLSLEGAPGAELLGTEWGARLLPALLQWTEGRQRDAGWTLNIEAGGGSELTVLAHGRESSGAPLSGRRLSLVMTALQRGNSTETLPVLRQDLAASAPGQYRASLACPQEGIYRVSLLETEATLCEKFVTVPYPLEFRRFGTDRNAMHELAAKAGGNSQVVQTASDLKRWAESRAQAASAQPLRGWLIALAVIFVLLEVAARNIRA